MSPKYTALSGRKRTFSPQSCNEAAGNYAEGLNRGLGFEALGDPEGILQSLNAGTGGALRLGLRQMPRYLRIDVLHPKQLVIYKLQHCLQLFEGELNSYFLHPDELILPRLRDVSQIDGPRSSSTGPSRLAVTSC